MKQILTYHGDAPLGQDIPIKMKFAKVVHVVLGLSGNRQTVDIWVETRSDEEIVEEDRKMRVIQTNEVVPNTYFWLGTSQQGNEVVHLYDVTVASPAS